MKAHTNLRSVGSAMLTGLRRVGRFLWRHPIICLLLAAGALAFSTPLIQTLRTEYHFYQARKALDEFELQKAEMHLAECLRLEPQNPDAYLLLTRTALTARDLPAARINLEHFRELGGSANAAEIEYQFMLHLQNEQMQNNRNLLQAALDPTDDDPSEPEAQGEPCDLYGDPLPPGAAIRIGTRRFRHDLPILSLVYSADGKTILSSTVRKVHLWDAATGRELAQFRRPVGARFAAAPAANLVAISETATPAVKLYNLATRQLQCSLDTTKAPDAVGGFRQLLDIALSSDGHLLATAGADAAIRLWDADTGQYLRTIPARGYPESVLALTPDGKKIAYVHHELRFHVFDTATGQQLVDRMPAALGPAAMHSWNRLQFSPDGRFLFAVPVQTRSPKNLRQMQLWDTATGTDVTPASLRDEEITHLAPSVDGRTLVYSKLDGSIHLCDRIADRELYRFSLPPSVDVADLNVLGLAPDGKTLATGGRDQVIRQWNVASGQEVHATAGHQNRVLGVAFSPDARTVATVSKDRTLRVWDARTGQQRLLLESQEFITDPRAGRQGLLFSGDGRMIFGNVADGSVRFWDAATGRELRRLAGTTHSRAATLVLSPSGKSLAVAYRESNGLGHALYSHVGIWEVATGRLQGTLPSRMEQFLGLGWASDQQIVLLLSVTDSTRSAVQVETWDLDLGERIHHFRVDAASGVSILEVVLAPDARRLAVQSSNSNGPMVTSLLMTVWDVATGRPLGQPWATYVSEGNNRLQELLNGQYQTEDPEFSRGGREPLAERLHTLGFSHDGRSLAIRVPRLVQGNALRSWEVATGQSRRALIGQQGPGTLLCFAPDNRRLATAGADTTALLWSLDDAPGTGNQALSLADLKACWEDLAGQDAVRAERAIWPCANHPGDAVPFLRERIKPVAAVEPQRVAKWIQAMASGEPRAVAQTLREIEQLGELAGPVLQKVKRAAPTLEVAFQLDGLLLAREQSRWESLPQSLREHRVVELLEHAATAEARALLQTLAAGAPEAHLTQEARHSLRRLGTGR
jgi:WD40 repeat protein